MKFSELELSNKNMESEIAYCVDSLNELSENRESIQNVLIYARSKDKVSIDKLCNIMYKYKKSCTLPIHYLILQQLESVVVEYRSFSNTDFIKNV